VGAIVIPKTIAEAAALGSKPGFSFLGGGTRLNGRDRSPERTLISLDKLGLSAIRGEAEGLILGATAAFQSVVDCAEVPPAVRKAASFTASRTLRNVMTVGGEIAIRSPSSALTAVLLCLGARIGLARRRKPMELEDYLDSAPRDLILKAQIPASELARACGVEILRRTSHAPVSMVVAVSAIGADPLKDVRIVVGDCEGGISRLRGAESALNGRASADKKFIEEAVKRGLALKPDIHASAAYKLYMAGVMTADLLHGLAVSGGGS
jgi:putative selenate reductase FAD-binding subunit